MSLRLITAPVSYPVTQAEAKLNLRIDGNDLNSNIDIHIATATALVEQYTGRAIMDQTWELVLDDFSDAIMLPKGPVQSITSVKYFDTAEVEQTLAADQYTLDNVSDPAWLVRVEDATYPEVADGVNNVIIRFVAGMDADSNDLKLCRGAILLTVKHLLDDPTSAGLPPSAEALLANTRSFAF
jgi:uncharacterized phiE125 gp8 family phage protein